MRIVLILLSALILGCSSPSTKKIVTIADYNYILEKGIVQKTANAETLHFWESRVNTTQPNFTVISKIANEYAKQFKTNSDIHALHRSDSLLSAMLSIRPTVETYQALATNAITQHQFQKAYEYLQAALAIGDKKAATLLMLADVNMELGDLKSAKKILKNVSNKNSFAFLIRQSKVKDKEGDLDSAIYLMEKALVRVSENKSLNCWTRSNLADMYGHAGRVAEAYQLYVEVLTIDPTYLYALKGIAWINFSHEKNSSEAKRILNFIQDKNPTPDYYLQMGQLAEFEKNSEAQEKFEKQFIMLASQDVYGAMYFSHLSKLYASIPTKIKMGYALAKQEVKNRPTVESYALLAWSEFKNGNTSEAITIAEEYVEGLTTEPEILYHLGMIYKESNPKKSKQYLEEAYESAFELGPLATEEIESELATL